MCIAWCLFLWELTHYPEVVSVSLLCPVLQYCHYTHKLSWQNSNWMVKIHKCRFVHEYRRILVWKTQNYCLFFQKYDCTCWLNIHYKLYLFCEFLWSGKSTTNHLILRWVLLFWYTPLPLQVDTSFANYDRRLDLHSLDLQEVRST